MKFLLAAILILVPPFLFAADAEKPLTVTARPDGSVVIVRSPAAAQLCKDQGGCNLISQQQFLEVLQQIKPELCSQTGV